MAPRANWKGFLRLSLDTWRGGRQRGTSSRAYKVDTDTFIEVSKEEFESVALESTRTIEIDEFVDRSEIDPRYLTRPYYLSPDGKVGHDAFAVIRETIVK